MAVKKILKLGNPDLYKGAEEVKRNELDYIKKVVKDMHDTMIDYKKRHGAGRAIAAPQIGVNKRIIYMYIDKPITFINPELKFMGSKMMEVWDDCMSFPELLVKVNRNYKCEVNYYTLDWTRESRIFAGDLSELIQHEYDHLNGLLAVARAVDKQSFCLTSQKQFVIK